MRECVVCVSVHVCGRCDVCLWGVCACVCEGFTQKVTPELSLEG